MDAVVAMTTTNTEREAKALAARIVQDRLAACVQIVPKIHSVYEWKGAIHDDQEYLLLIKTREALAAKLQHLLEEEHSYEVPEFLVLPVLGGSDNYLEWMGDVTK